MRGNRALPRHSWAEPADFAAIDCGAQTLLPGCGVCNSFRLATQHWQTIVLATGASLVLAAPHLLAQPPLLTGPAQPPRRVCLAQPCRSSPPLPWLPAPRSPAACGAATAPSECPLSPPACPARRPTPWCPTPGHGCRPVLGGERRRRCKHSKGRLSDHRACGGIRQHTTAHQAGPDPLHRPVAVVASPGDTLDGGTLAEAGQAGDNLEDCDGDAYSTAQVSCCATPHIQSRWVNTATTHMWLASRTTTAGQKQQRGRRCRVFRPPRGPPTRRGHYRPPLCLPVVHSRGARGSGMSSATWRETWRGARCVPRWPRPTPRRPSLCDAQLPLRMWRVVGRQRPCACSLR